MTEPRNPLLLSFEGTAPEIDPKAWLAVTATVIGRVSIGAAANIWYGAVLRGDGERIEIGVNTNIQDGAVVHTDPGFATRVGAGVTVGHRAVVHGCTVEDGALVGMGAVVMNGARVGAGSLIAAGAVVTEGADIPPGSLVAGVPGKVRRELTEEERGALESSAQVYLGLAAKHAESEPVSR